MPTFQNVEHGNVREVTVVPTFRIIALVPQDKG